MDASSRPHPLPLEPGTGRRISAAGLYLRFISLSIKAQLQYRASFVMQALGGWMVSASEYAALWALFSRFERLDQWRLAEVAVFYGVVNVAWAWAEGIGRGFDDFGNLVRQGEFDRVLLRPRSTVLQLLGRELTLRRVGRVIQGSVALTWGLSSLGLVASPGTWLWLGAAILGGIALFLGLLLLQATLAFWTVESLEAMNALTYGGVATAQYPLSIYPGWLRLLFTLVVPLGCFAYFPVVGALGLEDPLGTSRAWQAISPLLGFAFFGLGLIAWRYGVKHYTSAGS